MATNKVILYFEDQHDALQFTLAAGSVMSGEVRKYPPKELVQRMARATRIRAGELLSQNETPESASPLTNNS